MLQASDISKRYGAHAVLEGVSFVLNPGERLALVGPNGCGKTTLLRILAGLEQPDRGSVRRSPPDLRLGYLEQGLAFAPDATVAGALGVHVPSLEAAERRFARLAAELAVGGEGLAGEYERALLKLQELAGRQVAEHEAQAVLAGLGLGGVAQATPVSTLSGGQKARLALARLLLARPQVLLLDEPTNHLDVEALEWLEQWLLGFPGGVLLVSHDRALLDRLAGGILAFDPAAHIVRAYAGNYSSYLEEVEAERERQAQAYAGQNAEIARLRQAASHLRGLAQFHRGGKTDDNFKAGKFFFTNRSRFTVARAKHIEARVEKLLTEERVERPRAAHPVRLDLGAAARSGRDVLVLEGLAVGYGGRAVVRDVSELLRLGERVALVGPNGSGKTTLLRTITGELAPLAGLVRLGTGVQLGYYAQEQEALDPASTPLEAIAAISPMPQAKARALLHRYGLAGDEVSAPVARLSYGQRARLALACLVVRGCNLLLLDEPVNHLDIPGRAAFEDALAGFAGTVLAAVHDRYFIRRLAGRVWAIEEGRLTTYVDTEEWALAGHGRGMETCRI